MLCEMLFKKNPGLCNSSNACVIFCLETFAAVFPMEDYRFLFESQNIHLLVNKTNLDCGQVFRCESNANKDLFKGKRQEHRM